MRLIIASMKHETNTFSPVPTGLERFRERVLCFGDEVAANLKGTKTGLTSSDNALFNFEHVRRPIYPLDADAEA